MNQSPGREPILKYGGAGVDRAAGQREVFEESGIELASVCNLASQPWPFPGSLMLGFHIESRRVKMRLGEARGLAPLGHPAWSTRACGQSSFPPG